MSEPTSIVVEPDAMFIILDEIEHDLKEFVKVINDLAVELQKAAKLTYADGFSELIKKVEADINRVCNGTITAFNILVTTCKEVINDMVDKFAPEGAKSSYDAPSFQDIHLKVNPADRVAVYAPKLRDLYGDMYVHKWWDLKMWSDRLKEEFDQTKYFWVGTSAEKFRQTFKSKLAPLFDDLLQVLEKTIDSGFEWVDEAEKFEASLGVE